MLIGEKSLFTEYILYFKKGRKKEKLKMVDRVKLAV